MTDDVAALDVRGVSKSYVDGPHVVHALHGVDLTVAPGELVAVVGPSGSGKSTLLGIAGGLDEPSSGEVSVGGVSLLGMARDDVARLRRQSIGVVFQADNLLPGLRVAENVALPLELDGVPARRARRAVLETLALLHLDGRADALPEQLSGGERQRVAVARALVGGSRRLLLADEPTGALDTVTGEAVMRLLKRACAGGAGVVLVTHDAMQAAWADRVVFLRDGRVVDATAARPGPESLLVPSASR